jgi:hypothetical protein
MVSIFKKKYNVAEYQFVATALCFRYIALPYPVANDTNMLFFKTFEDIYILVRGFIIKLSEIIIPSCSIKLKLVYYRFVYENNKQYS